MTTSDVVISGPKVLSFDPNRRESCGACGSHTYGWRRALRRLRGKRADGPMSVRYCSGDKPPTEDIKVPSFFGGGTTELKFECAGIYHPHLHYTCQVCGATVLTELKEKR